MTHFTEVPSEQISSVFREKKCKGKQAASTARKHLVTRRVTNTIMELWTSTDCRLASSCIRPALNYKLSEGVGQGGEFVILEQVKEERAQLSTDVTGRQTAKGKQMAAINPL